MCKKLFILILFSASFAFAEKEVINEKYYVQGNLGYATGVAPGGAFEKNTFGNAGVYSFALGYRFDDHIRADWSLEYRNGFENKFYTEVIAYDENNLQVTKVNSLASFFNLYYDLYKVNKITPYIFGGMGMARNVTRSHGEIIPNSGASQQIGIKTGHEVNFAWKLGVGAIYEVYSNIDLGLNYQYVNLGKIATGRAEIDENGFVLGKQYTGKLQSHEFIINLKYNF